MMFLILMHGNQSILSSFTELSFVTNSPVAEEALFSSTDVGLFVSKAWYSFARLFDLFVSQFVICDRISSCARVVVVFTQGILFCAVISNY